MNKRNFLMNAAVVFALLTGAKWADSIEGRCKPISLAHGRSRIQRQGRLVRFRCFKGYEFVGRRYMNCFRGQWDFERDPSVNLPMCVKPGCRAASYVNGHFLETYKGAVVNVFCNLGYTLIGPSTVYCDGSSWNQPFPECKATNPTPAKSCDFEDGLCGWSQDPIGDWLWRNESAPTQVTPPYQEDNPGRYMFLADSSWNKYNTSEKLFSPVFPAEYSNRSCFIFWYKLNGDSAGFLKIYSKLEGREFYNSIPPFWITGDQGPSWHPGFFWIEPTSVPFQIIIEGIAVAGNKSEVAFDDVQIASGDICLKFEDDYFIKSTTTVFSTSDATTEDDDNLSCRNRCNQDAVVPYTNLTAFDLSEKPKCDCHSMCLMNDTCCEDYDEYCRTEVSTTVETTLMNSTPETITTTTAPTTKKRIKPTIPNTTLNKKTPVTDGPWKWNHRFRFGNFTTPRTKVQAFEKVSVKEPSKLEVTSAGSTSATGRRVPAGVIESAAVVVAIFVCGAVVGLVVRRRRRMKTEKESMVEDSDVRFLTSDEFLDFTLARPSDDDL